MPSLADGNPHAVLNHSGVPDASANPRPADSTLDFFALTADANHDRSVDTVDFGLLAGNFALGGKTYAQGDFNFDNVVDTIDFGLLAANFSTTLAPPNPGTARAAALPTIQAVTSDSVAS